MFGLLPMISGWFQFALPRGERRGLFQYTYDPKWFQFALPRGERLNTVPRNYNE